MNVKSQSGVYIILALYIHPIFYETIRGETGNQYEGKTKSMQTALAALTALATLPLLIAIVMLVVLQRSSLQSGLAALLAAMLLANLIPSFRLSPDRMLIALAEGFTTSLTVLTVLFPALLLYQLQHITGSMNALAKGIAYLCPERELQVLLLVLGLGPFIESASGFGVGTVVIIPILVAIGFEPLPAAMLGLLAQVAVPWGGLAVGIGLGAELTKLDPGILGMRTALLMIPLPFGFGLVALAMSGGKRALLRWWPAALLAGLVLSAGEWFFSQIPGIELAGILACTLVMLVLIGYGYIFLRRNGEQPVEPVAIPAQEHTIPLWQAVAPYIFLTVCLLVTRLIGPLQQWLQSTAVLSIPAVELRLPLLYTPGFWVLLAALFAVPLLGLNGAGLLAASGRTWGQFAWSAVAIISFLAMAEVMGFSGMTTVLGAAAATLGRNYGWIAPWLGALGGWLTGSNAGGNAMFALLQKDTSLRAGLPLDWIMGAQNSAGSIVTVVSPARTILATTTVGLPGKEGTILRTLGPLVLVSVAIIMMLLVLVI